jgi:hypothetical protein
MHLDDMEAAQARTRRVTGPGVLLDLPGRTVERVNVSRCDARHRLDFQRSVSATRSVRTTEVPSVSLKRR